MISATAVLYALASLAGHSFLLTFLPRYKEPHILNRNPPLSSSSPLHTLEHQLDITSISLTRYHHPLTSYVSLLSSSSTLDKSIPKSHVDPYPQHHPSSLFSQPVHGEQTAHDGSQPTPQLIPTSQNLYQRNSNKPRTSTDPPFRKRSRHARLAHTRPPPLGALSVRYRLGLEFRSRPPVPRIIFHR